jgi:hypothetical protein
MRENRVLCSLKPQVRGRESIVLEVERGVAEKLEPWKVWRRLPVMVRAGPDVTTFRLSSGRCGFARAISLGRPKYDNERSARGNPEETAKTRWVDI